MVAEKLDFGKFIEFEVKRRFGIITFNRTHRSNSFTIELLNHLKKAIKYCNSSKKIRGIMLTNKGDSFSTGMDIGAIDASDHEAVKNLEKVAAEICFLLWNGKPAISAVNGRTMGEGVVFMICCDYRIATKDSYFQMPEIYSGIFPGTGCTILFAKVLGIGWAKKLLMFAEKIDAKKALQINLIDNIAEDSQKLMKAALKKARFLFTKNQTVLNLTKLCVNNLFDMPLKEAYEIEKEASAWYEHKDKDKFLEKFRHRFI
jgi:enoyl-CoA hydratase